MARWHPDRHPHGIILVSPEVEEIPEPSFLQIIIAAGRVKRPTSHISRAPSEQPVPSAWPAAAKTGKTATDHKDADAKKPFAQSPKLLPAAVKKREFPPPGPAPSRHVSQPLEVSASVHGAQAGRTSRIE